MDLDKRVSEAFNNLVKWAEASSSLGKIAMQPNGQHERTISSEFCRLLGNQEWNGTVIHQEHSQGGFRRDIVALQNTALVFAIEVKTPFTNHDGINNKTRKMEYLPKDLDSLASALDAGAQRAYCLITPIGCYPANEKGEMIVLDSDNVRRNEDTIKKRFRIQWPTRRDYEASGKSEVERAMISLADERNLEANQIMGWTKVKLPSPQSGIHVFLDCALYQVRKKL